MQPDGAREANKIRRVARNEVSDSRRTMAGGNYSIETALILARSIVAAILA